jgi:hypothetical protein
MRSRLFVCAALAGTLLLGSWSSVAHAADPKAKKAKGGDSSDAAINKQMSWEDSVMGPDDKKGELEKIARAQAINKAAAEKAAKEKEKADAQAAREKEKADAAPKTNKKGGEVALPSLPDEDSGKGKNGKASEISPKLETAAAAAPPPPVKHGDDKFIDGLLKDDGKKKHKVSAADDKALDDLLAVEKPKATPAAKGKKKGDDVDSLLSSADKAGPMPETHIKHETPEWAKPEISSTRVEAPMPVRPQPKRDDGIIHVTQGAASASASMSASRRAPAAVPPPPPARTPAVATRNANSRRPAASDSGDWNDPFTAKGPKKTMAARESRPSHSDSGADDLDNMVPVNRRHPPSPARSDDDAAFRPAKGPAGSRRSAPAAKPKWKDPFTQSEAPAPAPARAKVAARTPAPASARATIASREPSHEDKRESSKWEVAAHHGAPAAASPTQGRSSGGWGVLKKRR